MRLCSLFLAMFILISPAFSMDTPQTGDHWTYMENLTPEENFKNVYKLNSMRSWQIVDKENRDSALNCYELIRDRTTDPTTKLLVEIYALGLKAIKDNDQAPANHRLFEISSDPTQPILVTASALYALGNLQLWFGPKSIEARENARRFYALILDLQPEEEILELKNNLRDEIKKIDFAIARLRTEEKLREVVPPKEEPKARKIEAPHYANSRGLTTKDRLLRKLHDKKENVQPPAQLKASQPFIPYEFEEEKSAKKSKPKASSEPVHNHRAELDAFLRGKWAKDNNLSNASYAEPVFLEENRNYKATVTISGKKYSGIATNKKAASQAAASVALKKLMAQTRKTETETGKKQDAADDIDVSFRKGTMCVAVKGECYTPKIATLQNFETKQVLQAAVVKAATSMRSPSTKTKAPYTSPIPEPKKIEGLFPPLLPLPNAIVSIDPDEISPEAHCVVTRQDSSELSQEPKTKVQIEFIAAERLDKKDLDSESGTIRDKLVKRYGKKAIFKHINPDRNKIVVNVLDNIVYVHIVEKNEIKSDNILYSKKYISLRNAEHDNKNLLKKVQLLRREKGFLPVKMEGFDDGIEKSSEINDAFVISIDLYKNIPYDGKTIPFNAYEIPPTVNMLIVAPRKQGDLQAKKNVIRVLRNGLNGLEESIAKIEAENAAIYKEIKALDPLAK